MAKVLLRPPLAALSSLRFAKGAAGDPHSQSLRHGSSEYQMTLDAEHEALGIRDVLARVNLEISAT